jgi:ribosomal protein S6--L-glutamate ligase
MTRRPAPGDFRGNVHRGAEPQAIGLDGPWTEAALNCAGHVGLEVAGVDFLENRGNLLLAEVNASPGLRGIETATGVDVAGALARICHDRIDT